MAAQLSDPAVDHDRDPVGIMCSVQPVRDRDDSTILEQRSHRALQMPCGTRVDQRRRLVQHQGVRVGNHQPGKRDLLRLRRCQLLMPGTQHGA